jgi:hypothetical protein
MCFGISSSLSPLLFHFLAPIQNIAIAQPSIAIAPLLQSKTDKLVAKQLQVIIVSAAGQEAQANS